jgi:hypothetical protein
MYLIYAFSVLMCPNPYIESEFVPVVLSSYISSWLYGFGIDML